MTSPELFVFSQNPLTSVLEEQFDVATLQQLLGQEAADVDPECWRRALHGPLADFLGRPGKEFRAELVTAAYTLAGGNGECPQALPLIVEILHAGSLVVDDIQDGSPMRRGRPALHIEYGMPVALNAANWMYFWAFTLVEKLGLEADLQLRLYRALSRTLLACHHGQGLDLTARMQDLSQVQVSRVVEASTRLKTGSLMALAATMGGTAARANPEMVAALDNFGTQLGVALQMLDDVGGLVSERRAAKGHEDLLHGRPTWPWAWLAEELPPEEYNQLRAVAGRVNDRSLHPELLAKMLREKLRGSGRVRVRRHIRQAFAQLRRTFGPSEVLNRIERETQRLEKSYG